MTKKKRLFVIEYVKNKFNATQAAKDSGYSEKTAYSQGQRLLKDVEVSAEIKKHMRKMLFNTEELTLKWLHEIELLSFSNIKNYLNNDGSPKDVSEIPDDIARAVQSISNVTTYKNKKDGSVDETTTQNVVLASKVQSLQLLGKYLAILHDNPPEPETEEKKDDAKNRKERLAYLLNKMDKK